VTGGFDALAEGRHGDPFAFLGPHGGVVRVFLPGAEAVEAVTGSGALPLARVHAAGGFEGVVSGPYRLRAHWPSGPQEIEDPYRFGPTLGPLDDHLLVEGTHLRLHERLGAHLVTHEGVAGVRFAVWAPNARRVSVVGPFNLWDGRRHPLRKRVDSGLWEIFLPGLGPGERYMFELLGADGTLGPLKADPYGRAAELRPGRASVVAGDAPFPWGDAAWMGRRARFDHRAAPLSIYEVHPSSWRKHWDGRFWDWDELAAALIPHAADLGFTHIQLMPVMEYPLDASWGYQPIGLHAPTARMGDPDGLKRLVDAAHRAGIGVLLDWVPAHFPKDAHGLAWFDGGPLYEHPDPRRGGHPEWGTAIYDFGRREVSAFLISNALYWLREFHADGLRVDAVSHMIWLDHGRPDGFWAPNEDGSTENREAVGFLRRLNAVVRKEAPGALMIAEEATSREGVTRPNGLDFHLKWNMGWMNDTLRYVKRDPVHRRWHHNEITFGLAYAWNEDFVLPLSHDEVVHGKGSLLGRLPVGARPGDDWRRFAQLRALYAHQWAHPGKKLLFMGDEFAQWREWSEERELDWWLLQYAPHQGVMGLLRELNRLHRGHPALHAADHAPGGFQWIEPDDAEASTFAWLRWDGRGGPPAAVVSNFTPELREGYLLGLPRAGAWREILNTDDAGWGGSGSGNPSGILAVEEPTGRMPASARVTIPPFAVLYLTPESWENEQDARA
jgi:1,4-alpha-glucan branching enzyme